MVLYKVVVVKRHARHVFFVVRQNQIMIKSDTCIHMQSLYRSSLIQFLTSQISSRNKAEYHVSLHNVGYFG